MFKDSNRSPGDVSQLESWIQDVGFSTDSSRPDDNILPAYSPTAEDSDFSQMPVDCCAFRRLNESLGSPSVQQDIAIQHPRHKFLCWFALCGMTDPNISSEVQWNCPFQWCDYVAQSADSVELLNHVTECQRFCEGRYICPYCHEPESFMPSQPRASGLRLTRRHFLKSAFTAICRLGTKSLHKAIHPTRSSAFSHDRRQSKKRRYTEVSPMIPPQPQNVKQIFRAGIELDSRALQPTRSIPLLETDPAELPVPSRRTRYFEMEGVLGGIELATNRFSAASSESALLTNPSVSSASASPISISPVTSEQWFFGQGFDSPISPADEAPSLPWSADGESHPSPSEGGNLFSATLTSDFNDASLSVAPMQSPSAWASVGERVASRTFPSITIDTSCSNTRPLNADDLPSGTNSLGRTPSPLQIEIREISPVKLTEELQGLFNTNVKLSRNKLAQHAPLSGGTMAFEGHPSPARMFELGWQTVAKVIGGHSPDSFSEVFAIAHLGYSSALATREIDFVEQLQPIFDDLTQWSYQIPSSLGRIDYLSIVNQLFNPQSTGLESTGRPASLDTETSLLTPTPLNRSFPSRPGHGLSRSSDAPASSDPSSLFTPEYSANSKVQKHESLRDGIIIQLCTQFLNLFEHASRHHGSHTTYRSTRNISTSLPALKDPVLNARFLNQNVIDRLTSNRSLESFRPVTNKALARVRTQPTLSLRDLELYLVYEGRRYAGNQSMYRKFVCTVAQLCDRASARLGPQEHSGRTRHLLGIVDQVLETHRRLLNNRASDAPRLIPDTLVDSAQGMTSVETAPVFAMQGLSQSSPSLGQLFWTETPTSAGSASPSTNDAGLFAFDASQQLPLEHQPLHEMAGAAVAFPSEHAAASFQISPSHGSPPATEEGTMKCQLCGQVFKGKVMYLQSNMRRHVRERHKADAKRVVCPFGGCGKAFARNHNLVQHQKAVHHAHTVGHEG